MRVDGDDVLAVRDAAHAALARSTVSSVHASAASTTVTWIGSDTSGAQRPPCPPGPPGSPGDDSAESAGETASSSPSGAGSDPVGTAGTAPGSVCVGAPVMPAVGAADAMAAQDIALVSRDLTELANVEQALARLHDGSYGDCADCGKPIPYARLVAYPAAKRCVACQENAERLEKSRK